VLSDDMDFVNIYLKPRMMQVLWGVKNGDVHVETAAHPDCILCFRVVIGTN